MGSEVGEDAKYLGKNWVRLENFAKNGCKKWGDDDPAEMK